MGTIKKASEKDLLTKKSRLPGAGKGLFTRKAIEKGMIVVEYKGRVCTWKTIQEDQHFNGYVFYINRNHVINAKPVLTALGRYANDAKGIGRQTGVSNNSQYIIRNKKVYIQATKDIEVGGEILVGYGKEYWDSIRYNHRLEMRKKKKTSKKPVK